MLDKHYPTLLGGVGRCLVSVGCWSVQTNARSSKNVGFQYQARKYSVFLITRTKMLDEMFEQSQTSSNIVRNCPTLSNMFDCAVQTGQRCCVQQCLTKMFRPFERGLRSGAGSSTSSNA